MIAPLIAVKRSDMSNRPDTWIGRKEQTNKLANGKSPSSRLSTKNPPYANSHKLAELNSLVSLFTDQQKKLAESTGFRSFSKEMHPQEFDKQFTAWLMPKFWARGGTHRIYLQDIKNRGGRSEEKNHGAS